MPGNPFVVNLSISQYLMLLGRGTARNSSFGVPAGPVTITDQSTSVVTVPIAPDSNDNSILIRNIQFDGIQSGMVGYSLIMDDGNEIAGYGVQGVPDVIELLRTGPLRFSIQSTQVTPFVVNIDFLSLKDDAVRSMIRVPLFQLMNEVSGAFGVNRAVSG